MRLKNSSMLNRGFLPAVGCMLVLMAVCADGGPAHTQSEKWLQYQAEKKEPLLAAVGSCLVPSLGHIYTGEAYKGCLMACVEALLFTTGIVLVTDETTGREPEVKTIGYVCLALVPILRATEIGLAVHSCNEHNRYLREKLGLNVNLGCTGKELNLKVALGI